MKSKKLLRMNEEGKKKTLSNTKKQRKANWLSQPPVETAKKKKMANGKKTKTSWRNLIKNDVRRDKDEYYNGIQYVKTEFRRRF